VLDDIGLAFPYSRAETLGLPIPTILRLHKRATAHLKRVYASVRLTS
jgi:hypothetical protein